MTSPGRDIEDLLIRALRTAAEPMEPSGDGLDAIRRRLAEPWLTRKMRLLVPAYVDLVLLMALRAGAFATTARAATARALSWAGSTMSRAGSTIARDAARAHVSTPLILARVRPLVAAILAAGERARSRMSAEMTPVVTRARVHAGAHRMRSTSGGWQAAARRAVTAGRSRPVLALAVAVVVIVTSVYAVGQLTASVREIGLATHAAATPTSGAGGGSVDGHQSRRAHAPLPSAQPWAATAPRASVPPIPSPTATCSSAAPTSPTSAPPAIAVPSPSATPDPAPTTPGGSANPSPGTTPSVAPTSTPSPTSTATPPTGSSTIPPAAASPPGASPAGTAAAQTTACVAPRPVTSASPAASASPS